MVVGKFSDILERFISRSPVCVMVRATMERILSPRWLDDLFERSARTQYTRTLLFSTVFDLMAHVVLRVHPSIHAAYQAADTIEVTTTALYDKLNHLEPEVCAALVRESGQEVVGLIDAVGGRRAPWLPGYRVQVIDGNCIAATEHRIAELRPLAAGALPGKTIVIYDPAVDAVVDVFPCTDGHAQERSLFAEIVKRIQKNDVDIADRNFCTSEFLRAHHAAGAFVIIRHHANLPLHELGPLQACGRSETGKVFEQLVEVYLEGGGTLILRRITVRLKSPARDGDTELHILTTLPRAVADPLLIAQLYRRRWTIETAFQRLERDLHSELNTLGYPQAALFGFCVALVAFNLMALVYAALRAVHGEQTIDEEFSGYYLANELQTVPAGMEIAVPAAEWRLFADMSPATFARIILELAQGINLARYRKHRRGPKKPSPKRSYDPAHPHVSTARLLLTRNKKPSP